MKKLIYILWVCLPFTSCSTAKTSNCDAYGFIYSDTLTLTTEHIDFNGECSPSITQVTYLTDTIYIPSIKNKLYEN